MTMHTLCVYYDWPVYTGTPKPGALEGPIELGELAEVYVMLTYTYTPGRLAQLYGPPEHCSPAEDPEIEIIEVLVQDIHEDWYKPSTHRADTIAAWALEDHWDDLCENAEDC